MCVSRFALDLSGGRKSSKRKAPMKADPQQYEYTMYPDGVASLNPILQKVLSLLVAVYNCPVEYRITESGVGIVTRPIKDAKNPQINLLRLRESFKRVGKEVVVVLTPCHCPSWAALVTANVEGTTFAVNLHLLEV